MDKSTPADEQASWPPRNTLADVQFVPRPHPALLGVDDLVAQCQVSALRRGGPGGQHRNKVSSAIVIRHLPTGIAAEANERRDQTQNRSVAIERLRLRLAFLLRSELGELPGSSQSVPEIEGELRERFRNRPLKVNAANPDRAALLALLLDDLHRAGGQPSLVANYWQATTSSLVKFVASEPTALVCVNQWRTFYGRSPLHRP